MMAMKRGPGLQQGDKWNPGSAISSDEDIAPRATAAQLAKRKIMHPKSRRTESRSTSPSKGPGNIVDSALGNPFAQLPPTGPMNQTPIFGQSSQPAGSVFGQASQLAGSNSGQTSASFPPSSSTNQNNPLFGGGGNASSSFTQPSTGASTGPSNFGFFSGTNQGNPFARDFNKQPLVPQISFGGSMFSVDSTTGKRSATFGIDAIQSKTPGTFGIDAAQSKTPGTFSIDAVQSKTPGTFGINATPNKQSATFSVTASPSQNPGAFQFTAMSNPKPDDLGVSTAPTHSPGTFNFTSTAHQASGTSGFGSVPVQTPSAFQSTSAVNKAPGSFGTSTGPSLTPGTFGAGFIAPNPSQIGYGIGPDSSINPLTATSPAMSSSQSPKQTSSQTVEFGSPNDNMQISPPVTPAKSGAEQATGTNSLFSRIEGKPRTNVLDKIESSHAATSTLSPFGTVAQTPINPNIFASPNAAFLAAATQGQPITITSTSSADTKEFAPSSTSEQPTNTQAPSAPSSTSEQPANTQAPSAPNLIFGQPANTRPASSTQVENNTDTGNSDQTSSTTASTSNVFAQSSSKSPVTHTANIFGTSTGSSPKFGQSLFNPGSPATKAAPAANTSGSLNTFATSSNALKYAYGSPTDKSSTSGPSMRNPSTDSIANTPPTASNASPTPVASKVEIQEQSKANPSPKKGKRSMPDLLRSLNKSLVRHLMSIVPDADLSPVCEAYLYERKRLLELEKSGTSTSEKQPTSSSSPSKKRKVGSQITKATPPFSPASDTASFFQKLIKKSPLNPGASPTSRSSSAVNPFKSLIQPTSQSSGLFTPKPASKPSSGSASTDPATSRPIAVPKSRKKAIPSANAGGSNEGFKPSFGATSSSSAGFTSSLASPAPTDSTSQFGQNAAKNAGAEKKKRKTEDFDSEAETEAEREAKDAKRRRQTLEKVSQQSGGKTAAFESGKGFSVQQSDESRNTSDVEQRSDSGNVQTSNPLGTAGAASPASAFASFAATARASRSQSTPSPNLKVPGSGDSASNIFGHISDANTSVHGDDEDSDDSLFEERGTKGSKRSAELISDEVLENDFGAAQKKRKPSPPAAPALNVEGTSSNVGKSLFERITAADKPSGSEPRSDQDLGNEDRPGDDDGPSEKEGEPSNEADNTAEDHTWKPATPIKFGQDDIAPSLNVTSPTPEKTSTDGDAFKTSAPKAPFQPFSGFLNSPGFSDNNGKPIFDFGSGLKIPTGPPPPIPTTADCFGSAFKRKTPSSSLQHTNPFDKIKNNSPGISSESEVSKEDDTAEKPVIQIDLTGLTEQESAEEDILFEIRAKCLRQQKADSGAIGWETKGAGPLRILKHKTTGVVRLLGRAAPSGKIIVNSLLNKNFDYIRASARTASIYVIDADGKPERNVIRMASDDDIKKFVKLCEENKPGNATGSP